MFLLVADERGLSELGGYMMTQKLTRPCAIAIGRLQQPVGIQGDREERTRVDRQFPPQQPGIRSHHCGGGWLLQAGRRPSAARQ